MDDRRICQTSTATPAEPGDLSWRLAEADDPYGHPTFLAILYDTLQSIALPSGFAKSGHSYKKYTRLD